MEFDAKYARERFEEMTREELLEEAALHTDQYVPRALEVLEAVAFERGITRDEIAARRGGRAAPAEPAGEQLERPALVTSAQERPVVEELAAMLRRDGIPAAVGAVDSRLFHGSGCQVGRYGLFVSGELAAEAGRRLDALLPEGATERAAACGSCGGGSCSTHGEEELPPPGDWDEDGDWWKTGAEGEDEG